jgi:hypothetical protein
MPRLETCTRLAFATGTGKQIPMRNSIPPQFGTRRKPSRMKSRLYNMKMRFLLLSAVLVLVALSRQACAEQAPTSPPKHVHAHKSSHHRKHRAAVHKPVAPPPPVVVAEPPPAPELPKWPVNDQPADAAVTWDSKGLHIEAANSSLQQILKDVSTDTGAKVEGLAADERVFGAYGPGQARDVISQLLQGSGYNVIMIGDQGHGTPRQILLSTRQTGNALPGANNNQANPNEDDSDADDQAAPPQFQPGNNPRPGFTPGGPPRTPQQQIIQEMQQRRQQQQQPNAPPN